MSVAYGQLVIGPPGSGKTTYVEGMHQLCNAIKRPHLVINLDFANDWAAKRATARQLQNTKSPIPYFDPPDIDVRDLITLQQVTNQHKLGPNGALLYCNRFLAQNCQWLKSQIAKAKSRKNLNHAYLFFDMPGQVELYTLDDSMQTILTQLTDKGRQMRLVAVHLVDSTLCIQPHQYFSALLVSLTAQIGLELPFINVLSKTDLLDRERDSLNGFSLEYFARAEDLHYLLPVAHQPLQADPKFLKYAQKEKKFAEFHQNICNLVEDFNLVGFLPLDIQKTESAMHVLAAADQANGFSLSAYLPSQLRMPGLAEQDSEYRLPVTQTRKIFGSDWFDDFDNKEVREEEQDAG